MDHHQDVSIATYSADVRRITDIFITACQGPEASPRCLDVINGRFGVCPASSPLKGLLDTDGQYIPGSGRFVADRVAGPGRGGEDAVTGLGLDGLLPGIGGLLNGKN